MAVETETQRTTPAILIAGLNGDMAGWLQQRLGDVAVQGTVSAEDTLAALGREEYALLILNHTLPDLAGVDVLARVRANPSMAGLPVMYLLDRHLDSAIGRQLLEQLGVTQLLLYPIDREEVAHQASCVLDLPHPTEPAEATVEPEPPASPTAVAPLHVPEGRDDHAYLLLVNDDPELAERLANEAVTRGLRVEIAADPIAARDLVARERPDAVLLDVQFHGATDGGLALLKEMSQAIPPIPVLVLTASDTFLDRVQVASLGGRGFLPKALPPSEILDTVTRLLQQLATSESRVMAVDGDPATLATLHAALDPQGIRLTTLDDPLRFWDTLEQSTPDLLILDLNMPRLSGIELCRVVRNDPRWSALPVLFLTENSDADTVRRVFSANADDFVPKPIIGPELVTKVVNRLERTLLYRSMAEIDPVTGVTNRAKSTHTLRQFLRLAERHRQPLSLALLDVDHFKQINDRHGHATGDAVLQQLGKILLRTFRSEDVVARWGGEEFLIGMYGMTRIDGVQRLADLLETLRHESLLGPKGERISITFSAGVAQFPADGTDLQVLYRAADEALYRAKASGRDRVLPVGWQAESSDLELEAVDVVLVDNDDVQGGVLTQALEALGYRTVWLRDGESATLLLGGLNPRLQAPVALVDSDLPEIDGLGVVRRLARDGILRHTRLIFLSSGLNQREVERVMDLGVFDRISRPYSLPTLVQHVRRALEIL